MDMKPKEKNRLHFQTVEEMRAKVTFQEFKQMNNVDKFELFLITMDYASLLKEIWDLAIKYTQDHLTYYINQQQVKIKLHIPQARKTLAEEAIQNREAKSLEDGEDQDSD